MSISARLTNLRIEISWNAGPESKHLEPAADADQEKPRKHYVYAHVDGGGRIFYIGKGVGRRAWSKDRHLLWCRFVEKHLNGKYDVQILQDNLTSAQADELEAAWIAQCGDSLVNWSDMGRAIDLDALARHSKLRDANRALIREARRVEGRDIERAVAMYAQAIEAIHFYAFINYEKGLVGKLLAEDATELGHTGEFEALDRLTMCLLRLGRPEGAESCAQEYYSLYRRDRRARASERIAKRIGKMLGRKPSFCDDLGLVAESD